MVDVHLLLSSYTWFHPCSSIQFGFYINSWHVLIFQIALLVSIPIIIVSFVLVLVTLSSFKNFLCTICIIYNNKRNNTIQNREMINKLTSLDQLYKLWPIGQSPAYPNVARVPLAKMQKRFILFRQQLIS